MALSPVVPVYGPTSTKGTSIKTISLISGIMSLNRIVTASGLKRECADCKMFRYCEGNGMHLYDDEGNLLVCHYKRLVDS